jgi:hypothetical protein
MRSTVSEEDIDLEEIEGGTDTSDASGPPNPPPELERKDTCSQQPDALHVPVKEQKKNVAYDCVHFFHGFGEKASEGEGQAAPKRICKLCSYVLTL